jgi:hypothetical protein
MKCKIMRQEQLGAVRAPNLRFARNCHNYSKLSIVIHRRRRVPCSQQIRELLFD